MMRRLAISVFAMFVLAASAKAQSRMVVIGPELVEIVAALGAEQEIVAVDQHSTYPKAIKGRNTLGYFRNLSAEGILAVSPDLIIASPDAGPAQIIEQIKSTGLKTAIPPRVTSPQKVPELIRFIGQVINKNSEAEKLVASFNSEMDKTRQIKSGDRNAVFLMAIKSGTPIAAGTKTVPNLLIKSSGGKNIASFQGFKPISPEAMLELSPDVIIMMPDRVKAGGGIDVIAQIPGIAETIAGKNKAILEIDASLIMRLGLRTPEAIRMLKTEFGNLN